MRTRHSDVKAATGAETGDGFLRQVTSGPRGPQLKIYLDVLDAVMNEQNGALRFANRPRERITMRY